MKYNLDNEYLKAIKEMNSIEKEINSIDMASEFNKVQGFRALANVSKNNLNKHEYIKQVNTFKMN